MKQQKLAAALAAGIWLAVAGSFPAAAAPIRQVKIHLAAEGFDEDDKPILEAYSTNDKYEVSGFNELSTDVSPETADTISLEADVKEYEIELTASEEDGFSVMEQKDIRLTGIGGSCKKAVRKDSGQTLLLTVQPNSLGEVVGETGNVILEEAMASWQPAANASGYLVMLYRDSKRVGNSHRTAGLSYDFSPLIRDPGVYYCKVYPLTERGKKVNAAESAWSTIKSQDVGRIIQAYQERSPIAAVLEDGIPGWYRIEDEWYYIQKDGAYPQETWLELDGRWYYFDCNGKMETDSWRQKNGTWHYLGVSGLAE